jgi:CheY-like chemotaxis protein
MDNKLLIVEDQSFPLEALEAAVKSVGFGQYDVARCYSDAESRIQHNTYDLVLLDHRMPREIVCTEEDDFDRFSASLENIGYGLIPSIKQRNPSAVVVGTSSLNPRDLCLFPRPDYIISKMPGQAGKDLERVLAEIKSQ